ncbi:jacalin-like lectin [Actibacterium ureilyticum]|uniref:jacalin-like lectin n=1 Tax=Actibacterium ureilyticum TaxID=1590614 RepID=UPI000BAAEF8C|nr:jacalin-like lectin [Actibacterium ureilyticum]
MTIQTIAIGGDHGTDFDIQAVRSIGFRASNMVEAVLLNGSRHGDKQGSESLVLDLQQDEYINKLVVHEGYHKKRKERRIYGVDLTTSLGRGLRVGTLNDKTAKVTKLEGVRILGLGGNVGHMLFKLRARYIADYTESALIESGAIAVTSVIPQGQTFESFESSRVSKMNASRTFLETVTSIEHTTESSAAVGEFTAKASMTFGLSVTTQSEFSKQVETETVNSERMTYAPPAGHVGLEVVRMDVFRASDGTVWFFPTSEPSIVSAAVSGDAVIQDDLYDMTGTLPLHLPYMAQKCYGYERFAALQPA